MIKILMNDSSVNINATKIKFIPLDSSHREESNKKKFIKIQSADSLKTGVCMIEKFLKIPLK